MSCCSADQEASVAHSVEAKPSKKTMSSDNVPPAVLTVTVKLPMAEAEAKLRDALKANGFGVLTEIDVAETLKKKLGVDMKPHKNLGACNPTIAYEALSLEMNIGALIPCGVSLREGDSPAETIIALQNPAMFASAFGPKLAEVGAKGSAAIEKVIQQLSE